MFCVTPHRLPMQTLECKLKGFRKEIMMADNPLPFEPHRRPSVKETGFGVVKLVVSVIVGLIVVVVMKMLLL